MRINAVKEVTLNRAPNGGVDNYTVLSRRHKIRRGVMQNYSYQINNEQLP